MNAQPVYSDRGAPTGPVMSPDDPRYGRPMGPPPVIYGDRAPGPQQQGYPRQFRCSGRQRRLWRHAERRRSATCGRPRPLACTGAVPPQQAPVGADGKPVQLAALPPDDQPEDGPAQLAPNLRRQEVAFATKEPAGTIVVDTPNTYLYYVLGNGRAIRYGVRVGRDGFTWTGVQKITRKAEWPDWHPPTGDDRASALSAALHGRRPGNPLGARAMYLGSTVYRIHGTNQPSTIGKFVSSGCIGMLNEDVSDLFERAKVGTRVVVMPGCGAGSDDGFRSGRRRTSMASAAPAGRAAARHSADRGAAAARAGDGALDQSGELIIEKARQRARLLLQQAGLRSTLPLRGNAMQSWQESRHECRLTYPPLNTPKPVAEDVWIVDGPLIRFGPRWFRMPFPTRAHDHAPARMRGSSSTRQPHWWHELKAEIATLGAPRWIIGPNRIHYWWIPEWHAAYPDARVFLAPRIKQQAGDRLTLDSEPLEAPIGLSVGRMRSRRCRSPAAT